MPTEPAAVISGSDAARAALRSQFSRGRKTGAHRSNVLFFNLKLGEIVLQTHAVPTTNLLSFTHPSAPDVNLAWIFQVFLALAHRAAGVAGTVVLKTAFALSVVALSVMLFSDRDLAPVFGHLSPLAGPRHR